MCITRNLRGVFQLILDLSFKSKNKIKNSIKCKLRNENNDWLIKIGFKWNNKTISSCLSSKEALIITIFTIKDRNDEQYKFLQHCNYLIRKTKDSRKGKGHQKWILQSHYSIRSQVIILNSHRSYKNRKKSWKIIVFSLSLSLFCTACFTTFFDSCIKLQLRVCKLYVAINSKVENQAAVKKWENFSWISSRSMSYNSSLLDLELLYEFSRPPLASLNTWKKFSLSQDALFSLN